MTYKGNLDNLNQIYIFSTVLIEDLILRKNNEITQKLV